MKQSLSVFAALGLALVAIGCANSSADNAAPTASVSASSMLKTQSLDLASAVGKPAPAFALPDQGNKTHRLADSQGKPVIISFYPKDMTGGCTLEARGLTSSLPEFKKRGVQVFGVSVQDVNSKKEFCDKEGIKYPMLADVSKSVAQSYGVLGSNGLARRVTFIVAPDGTIASVDEKVNPQTHATDLLAVLDGLKEKFAVQTRASANTAPAKIEIDKPVAAFDLPNTDGKNVTVGNWAKDGTKATVLLYVSVQCPISNDYNGRMIELAKIYGARNVRFIGINSNVAETPAKIAAHAKDHGFNFPVLKDAGNIVADRFNAQVTPEAFVIDDKGVLRYHGRVDDSRNQSKITTRDLQAALDSLLAGRSVTTKQTLAFGCTIKRAAK